MVLKGKPVSPGVAIGRVYRYEPFTPRVEKRLIDAGEAERSIALFEELREKANAELCAIVERQSAESCDKAKIFTAHIDILYDEVMAQDVKSAIADSLYSPEYAVETVFTQYAQMLSKAKDPLIRERASDLVDVKERLLRLFFGAEHRSLKDLTEPVILAARDLMPSDTATMNRQMVLGILTETGGETSHSAILARSYGIPAILGIPGLMSQLRDGEAAAADAMSGEVILQPTAEELKCISRKRAEFDLRQQELQRYLSVTPVTLDGVHIDVALNIGGAGETELLGEAYADGVGLFRSEFLYMNRASLPDEQEQLEAYSRVLETFGERPVVIRTLDVGGDKQLGCLELLKEENPFLGLRALRLCFDMMPVFKTQLRALLRASVRGSLWIMFPMVGSLGDIRFAKRIVEEVKLELLSEGRAFRPDVKIGIMVEIPSIALMADIAAEEVDFASIGTNDLCQYLTAVDRLNPKVAKYYQSYHPAMFRLIGSVTDAFNRQGKPVSVCGELAGEPMAASVLIGLGIKKLSMSLSSVAPVKRRICELNVHKAERMARTVLGLSTAAQVESFLSSEFAANSPV